jgi:hypothetical protein
MAHKYMSKASSSRLLRRVHIYEFISSPVFITSFRNGAREHEKQRPSKNATTTHEALEEKMKEEQPRREPTLEY